MALNDITIGAMTSRVTAHPMTKAEYNKLKGFVMSDSFVDESGFIVRNLDQEFWVSEKEFNESFKPVESECKGNDWRDMESAPKDGTEILVDGCCDHDLYIANWTGIGWHAHDICNPEIIQENANPIRWLPLRKTK